MTGRVEGKVAIVTGAGRDGNIGVAVCRALLREGAKAVVGTDMRTDQAAVIADHAPTSAAVEEVFVNDNPQSTLKLAHARGVALLACARGGLPVGEYAPRLVKKAVVGTGGAAKEQVQAMLRVLLPGAKVAGADAADALAVAICHANHRPRH